jgi:acetolactate synthase I/II/III large subunit
MKVSDAIAIKLKKLGINTAFVVAGGMITHLIDSFSKYDIKIITNYHEQGSAFGVFGASKVTNKPFVAMATSGPGATNLLTGIGSCYFDSVPSIFITGQVNTHEKKGNKGVRQLGFQETEICLMAKSITKACFEVTEKCNPLEVITEAYRIAVSGRPGPVLIDIPMNLQSESIFIESELMENHCDLEEEEINEMVLTELIQSIKKSKKPLIVAGRGISCSGSQNELKKFVELTKIPLVKSLLGLDTFNEQNEYNVGFIGSYGNRWANVAIGDSDLLIVLGSRLDIRQTGARVDIFQNKKIYHVDVDLNEINNRIKGCIQLNFDLRNFLNRFNNLLKRHEFQIKQDWVNEILSNRAKWPSFSEQKVKFDEINPNYFVYLLSKSHESKNITFYSADVGSHQMWAAQSLVMHNNQKFITCGGMGAMGSALPSAIGASIALNKSRGVVFVGDGSFQMNIQELQTIVHHNLPITIIVFNNKSLGMIRQFQDSYFEARYHSTVLGYSTPDFKKIGLAYGIESISIKNSDELKQGLENIFANLETSKPLLVELSIPMSYNALPKIAFGRTIKEMEPQFKPSKIEST